MSRPAPVVLLLQQAAKKLTHLQAICLAAIAFWVQMLLPKTMEDPDIWWHLRNASQQWEMRSWLHRDIYSFTAYHASWIDPEWLAEVPFYLAFRLAQKCGSSGTLGLYLLTLMLLEAIFLGLFWLSWRASGNLAAALMATGLGALLSTVSFGPRTLLFGWACLVIELITLRLSRDHPRLIFALPLLFAVWVNLHGSWLIGLTVLLLSILSGSFSFAIGALQCSPWPDAQRHRLWSVLLLSIAALFFNPDGWRMVFYPFDLAFYQKLNIANVQEWQPLSAQSMRGAVFLVVLAGLFLLQLTCRQRWSLTDLTLAALGTLSAFLHTRFLFLAAILLSPALADQLAAALPSGRSSPARMRRPALSIALGFAMLLLSLTTLFSVSAANRDRSSAYPAAALPFLRSFTPQGRLFHEYLWGGYLTFYAPQIPVFIDSRVDIFERNGTLRDYLAIIHIQDSLALLDRYRIRYVLFERDTPLVYLLQQSHAWKSDYDDGKTVLLERRIPLEPVGLP